MKEIKMFSKIKDLQKRGFSARKTAEYLGISRDTVSKYRSMELDEFMELSENIRKQSALDNYKQIVLDWLYDYPSMTAAQVHDWLLEHYPLQLSQRSVSRYVKGLREEYGIAKTKQPRDYEAVDELPAGYQMQLDFGVKNMPLADRKGSKKVYFVGVVLSHSRFKWGYFQDRPFTSRDLIIAMDQCFKYFGGTTKEIVVDQDSIITVSENAGDIVYTYEFEKYKQLHHLNIRVCRRADPESKGKVESVVKYIKRNFLPHRYFMEMDFLNLAFLAWLGRTGNGKEHGTTKKVPAKVFEVEREHLIPILNTENKSCDHSIPRRVRKDNTILFNSNRYSLPLGSYHKEVTVDVRVVGDNLQIWQCFGDYMITEHKISLSKGQLIKSSDHRRNKEESLDDFHAKVLSTVGSHWEAYLLEVRRQKSRYYRDQLQLLKEVAKDFDQETLESAYMYCSKNELYSINDVRSACKLLAAKLEIQVSEPLITPQVKVLSNPAIMHIVTQKRDLNDYADLGGEVNE